MNKKIFGLSILFLLIDQISKIIISAYIELDHKVVVIKNFFNLHNINNYGAAFSILDYKVEFLIIVSLVALIVIYRYMFSFKTNFRNNLAFSLVLGGLMGNLIDRIFLGYVRDFLSFKIFSYNYPIFNFADSFIVIGVILLIIAIIKGEDKIEKDNSR